MPSKTSSRCLQDVMEEEKLVLFVMTKIDNRFVFSLDFNYVLHHCNSKKVRIYSNDVTECIGLKGDKI